MTFPFDITNGASLEDGHTNYLALIDLNGIKWRRLSTDSIFLDFLEDPILKTFSNCLSVGILSVWKRILDPRTGLNRQENCGLSCFKELWIFWHGEEPDFSGILEGPLIEADRGSWENGLSYECRTMLFKALHNSIERLLLSRGYTRIGRYFVQPQTLSTNRLKKTEIAYSLKFFVHGESTVCTTVNVVEAPSIYILNKCHINAALSEHTNVKVIVSPYGLEGKLTGVGYKFSDPMMARFLNNWHMFYPYPHGRAKWKVNSEVPSVVEVIVGNVRSKYPSSYVFVTFEDHSAAFPKSSARGDGILPTTQPNPKSSYLPAPGLLTPPLSPAENSALGDFSKYNQNAPTLLNTQDDTIQEPSEMNYSNLILHSVSQEGYIPTLPEKPDDNSTLWDFQDPSLFSGCSCNICVRKQNKLKNLQGPSNKDSSSSNSASQSHSRDFRSGRFFPKTPFHRRSTALSIFNDCPPKSETSKPMPVDFRTSSTSLPQLQTPFSHLKKQSAPVSSASVDASYSQLSSSDPVMPTLSPQPPVVKDEAYFQTDEEQSCLSRDSPQGVTLKGKISDELLSPFHTSLLNSFENAKLANKQSPKPAGVEIDQTEDAVFTSDAVITVHVESPLIEKPILQKRSHEESDDPELTMSGFLYDYKHLASPLWKSKSPLPKRLCLSSHSSLDVYKEELNDSDCDITVNGYDLDDTVPCIPKDPYEFTEFDETAPSERGFRQKEFSIKEEKCMLPTTTVATVSTTPMQSQEPVAALNEDSDKEPSAKNFCPKFIREEDLAVSYQDLDNIFDTSSSDGEDNSEMPITPSKLITYDDIAGKIELSRMYPTPPSLEQHAVPSPFAPLIGNDTVIPESDAYREELEMDHLSISHEHIDVWYPPLITEFVEPSKYAALSMLPSYYDSKSDQELVYKPIWTRPKSRVLQQSFTMHEDSQMFDAPQVHSQQNSIYEDEPMSSHLYSQESALDSQFSTSNCEAVSPPSSVPSYLNRNLNSMDASVGQSMVEINPLVLTLLLSDSILNFFKDHNFDGCAFCVCNMNIKGSDAGSILPTSLIPTWNDEPQYRCNCGFSAVVHRHRSYNSGLFYEDELEVIGSVGDVACSSAYLGTAIKTETAMSESQKAVLQLDKVPGFVLDLLRIQCKTLASPFSLFHKFRLSAKSEPHVNIKELEMSDCNEIANIALEDAKMYADSSLPSKFEESLKSSLLHRWSFLNCPVPSYNQDVRLHLESLKPLLQVAVHKKNTQKIWDVTYVVTGPLTWREFHRLASRGTEDQCEPQPIPSLLLGHEKETVALSPFSLKHWDPLHLEPHSLPRDIAYIVVAPENELVLSKLKPFFRELSSTYESHNLGKHRPITKVLREGIMRVGKTAASKVAEEPVSEWFDLVGDGPIANRLKLYARVCKHRLAPHLSTLSLDNTIFNPPLPKSSDGSSGTFSSTSHFSESNERLGMPRPPDNDHLTDSQAGPSHESFEEECHNVPALVIYVVEPFTYGQTDPDVYRLVTLGILHAFADMLSSLPEATRNAIHLQVLSLDSIICHGGNKPKIKRKKEMKQRKDQLKALAFSVYSQSYHSSTHQLTVKSLTGFGPAAAQDKFMNTRNNKLLNTLNVYNQPYVIASVKDKQTELGEMFGDRRETCGVLYCSYCLTKDKKYIIVCCTNDKGEFIETTAIHIGIPNRRRRKQTSVRRYGLLKVLDFILEVISVSVHPWRLIIDRFGRMGHGELKTWAQLLTKKSLQSYSKRLREMCNQCSISGTGDGPSILSACLVSLGPDSALRIMNDQFTPDDRFSSNRYKTCQLSTPEDASCTHILVFPTSATTQSSQATFQQEHIDPIPGGLGDDLFVTLDEEDLPGTDMNDIFRWSESPPGPENSPRRDSLSQPSSPGTSFRMSSGHGEQNKCENILTDGSDEEIQLLQQPLALGYYVSTAKTGPLPKWFWAACPAIENKLPVFLKSALIIHLPFIQISDDVLHNGSQQPAISHPLDSNLTTDVLRYVLEGYNALSWLQMNSKFSDRRSCLPIHIQILMQLYGIVETIL